MATLNTTPDIDLTDRVSAGTVPAGEGLWSKVLELVRTMVGKPWSFLNEDMGAITSDDDFPYIDDCCA